MPKKRLYWNFGIQVTTISKLKCLKKVCFDLNTHKVKVSWKYFKFSAGI